MYRSYYTSGHNNWRTAEVAWKNGDCTHGSTFEHKLNKDKNHNHRPSNSNQLKTTVTEGIELVHRFVYLKYPMTDSGGLGEIKRKATIVIKAMGKTCEITKLAKLRILRPLNFLAFMCRNCRQSRWLIYAKLMSLKCILRISWPKKNTNELILKEIRTEERLGISIRRCIISYFGHVISTTTRKNWRCKEKSNEKSRDSSLQHVYTSLKSTTVRQWN